jgi:hypothetical protein
VTPEVFRVAHRDLPDGPVYWCTAHAGLFYLSDLPGADAADCRLIVPADVFDAQFVAVDQHLCPTCGQPIPEGES